MLDLSTDLYNLRGMGVIPRVHGNGFIQIDLDDVRRLHIWGHPDIPHQKTYSPIHDHIFNFTSHILAGRMVNVNYELIEREDGNFNIYHPAVRNKEDTVLEQMDDKRYVIWPQATAVVCGDSSFMGFGRQYHMAAGVFHETFPTGPTATIIFKMGKTQAEGNDSVLPRVLVPRGVDPDNEFDRYGFDEDKLWDITFEVLKGRQ